LLLVPYPEGFALELRLSLIKVMIMIGRDNVKVMMETTTYLEVQEMIFCLGERVKIISIAV
jgi:hypothetical protein